MDRTKYVIWNNKGGVGKTFLTYVLSVEYAISHPDEEVIVVDACPQSNVSEMVLGGNGKGEQSLDRLRDGNTTIAGYIKARYERSASNRLGTESNYFIDAHKYNQHMPKNLYILPGDVDLDICSGIINYMGQAPQRGAWKRSRMLLDDMIDSFSNRRESQEKRQVYFIDCNPSFANYTEMAVLAATHVIIPCTADAASIRGIKNLFKLIYGISTPDSKTAEDDIFLAFNSSVRDAGLSLPKIHLFVQNKSRSNLKDAAAAFQSHALEIEEVARRIKDNHSDVFSINGGGAVLNVKDGNTLASIINHVGMPLSQLPSGDYKIYGQTTRANKTQITRLIEDVARVLTSL